MRLGRIAHFVGRHDPGAKGAGLEEIFPRNELAGVPLIFADRAFVVAGIPRHHALPVFLGDVTAALAYDHRHLALVIERHGRVRAHHRRAVSDLGRRETGEHDRLLRRLPPAFQDVRQVVQPDAQDFLGVGDRRQERDVGQLERGMGRGLIGQRRCCPQRMLQRRRSAAEVDDPVALHDTPAGRPIRAAEAHQFHRYSPQVH